MGSSTRRPSWRSTRPVAIAKEYCGADAPRSRIGRPACDRRPLAASLEAGGGLYWVVAAIVFATVGAVANAWVLLVEILR